MARILYGVSPIGLGHATRAVAVGERLLESGAELAFVTGGPAAETLRDSGFRVEEVVREPVPRVKDGEMKNAVSWYLSYWRLFRRTKKAVAGVLGGWKPAAVVGDEEFSSVTLALERGIPQALITDELELGFARTWPAKMVEARVAEWYADLQRRVSLLIIPEAGDDDRNRRFVGPIVRRATKSRAQVREELGLPGDKRLLLLALSGTGIGSHLVDGATSALSSVPDSVLVVMGNRGRRLTGERVFDLGVVRDGQNLVAAADIVVSTAGKSTIDEAATFGTPIVTIPIRNHSEQLRNAASLGFSPEDRTRLPELVALRIGRRRLQVDSRGAQRAANLILSLPGA